MFISEEIREQNLLIFIIQHFPHRYQDRVHGNGRSLYSIALPRCYNRNGGTCDQEYAEVPSMTIFTK